MRDGLARHTWRVLRPETWGMGARRAAREEEREVRIDPEDWFAPGSCSALRIKLYYYPRHAWTVKPMEFQ